MDRLASFLGLGQGVDISQRDTTKTTPTSPLLRRIIFVRHMNEREYLTFCSILDVVLDPFPVGGGRSSFEIFSVGTPIVFLYPRTSILQLTAGMYHTMGIGEDGRGDTCCIADTNDEFVRKAVMIGANCTAQAALRQDILHNNHRLYGNLSVVRVGSTIYFQ